MIKSVLFFIFASAFLATTGPATFQHLPSTELKTLLTQQNYDEVSKRICPGPSKHPSCYQQLISDFKELGGNEKEVSGKQIGSDKNHAHFYFGDRFMVKSYTASDDLEKDHAFNEINMGLRVKDSIQANKIANMTPLESCCQDKANFGPNHEIRRFYLVFKRHKLGSLSEFLADKNNQRLVSSDTWKWVVVEGILNGLRALHEKGFIHRDIKPDNLLMADEWTPMLADFGFSKKFDEDVNTVGGTPIFQAPEMKNQEAYSLQLDIWNAGALIYYLTVPKNSGWTRDWVTVARNTCKDLQPSMLSMDSETFIHCKYFFALIVDMLQEDPAKRPSAEEVYQRYLVQLERILQHQNLVYYNFAGELKTNGLPANHPFRRVLLNAYQNTQKLFSSLKGNPDAVRKHIQSLHPGWFEPNWDFLDKERMSWANGYYNNFIMANVAIPDLFKPILI